MEEILGSENLQQFNTPVGDLETESVNLVCVGIDISGSMSEYRDAMNTALSNFKHALESSKESDQLLVARIDFDSAVHPSGYKKLNQLDTDYNADGGTALYDAIISGSQNLVDYMSLLRKNGMRTKAVFAIFSDGEDRNSVHSEVEARNAIANLARNEISTAFISFCKDEDLASKAKAMGFKSILKVDSSASELRRAFDCLSRSVIAVSKAATVDGDTNVFKL
jgi:uncharacterized protein with von Willebrand factor type A (vWA) domain